MKATGYVVLGILVVLCFGLLVAFKSPASPAPEPQIQNQSLVDLLNTTNHQIDPTTALRLIANLKGKIKTNATTSAISTNPRGIIGTRGGAFSRRIIDKILAQPGCIGIRFYYAQKDDGTPTVVLLGVSSAGADIATESEADAAIPCPPYCD
jgi:hypothetical protein